VYPISGKKASWESCYTECE